MLRLSFSLVVRENEKIKGLKYKAQTERETEYGYCIATAMRNTNNNNNSQEDQRKKESTLTSPDSRFNQTLRNVQGYGPPQFPRLVISNFSLLFG
jgi:hypothetical protein